MSFPHRTWFYDRRMNCLRSPKDEGEPGGEWSNQYGVNQRGEIMIPEFAADNLENILIPLASTGVKNHTNKVEVIEGHIMQGWTEDSIAVVQWRKHNAQFSGPFFPESNDLRNGEVLGHALTDPDLVPDGFDPTEYWEQYDGPR